MDPDRWLAYPPAVTRSRLRRLAGNLALVVTAMVFVCLIGEIALRVTDYEGLSLNVRHPVLGQTYKPSHDTVITDAESKRRVRVVTNSLGFRDLERSPARGPGRRVLVLGDSFVAGLAVDFEQTFPRVTEAALRQRTGQPWEVMSFAVAGWGTAQQMLAYREHGRALRPDVVVLAFFSGNDVSDNSSELSTNPRVYFRMDDQGRLQREPAARLRGRTSELLNRHSRFYVWQKTQMNRLEHLFKRKVVVNPVHRVFAHDYDVAMERAWAVTRALVDALRADVEADGARFLMLYVPYSDEVNPDWWEDTLAGSPPMREKTWDLGKAERRLAAHCRERGIVLVSLRPPFLAREPASPRLYFEHGHLNELGHRKAGEILAEEVLALTGAGR